MDEWFASLAIHPEDLPRRLAAMQAHLAGKTPAYEGEFRLRQPDGIYRWRRLHGLCLRDADGHGGDQSQPVRRQSRREHRYGKDHRVAAELAGDFVLVIELRQCLLASRPDLRSRSRYRG